MNENDLAEEELVELDKNQPIATLANRGSRIVAFILDLILISTFTIMLLTTFVIPKIYPGALIELKELSSQNDQSQNDLIKKMTPQLKDMLEISQTIIVLAFWLYFATSEITLKGASLGKLVFSIRVANDTSLEPPSAFDSILRSGFKTFSLLIWFPAWFPLFIVINLFLLFFTKKGQAGHDFLCRTIVIQGNLEKTNNHKWE
jgi:uncharacterized RDD family membrane protein YckC